MDIYCLRKAVIFHLYYQEMWEKFKSYLKNLEEISGFDLYITTPRYNEELFHDIQNSFSESVHIKIQIVENLGADLYPFIEVINSINLDDYDVIYKIHTKRDLDQRVKVEGINCGLKYWREFMINDILGKSLISSRLNDFIINPMLGESGFFPYLILVKFGGDKRYHYPDEFSKENKVCKLPLCQQYKFYAGTMFMIRASLLKCLQGNFGKKDFEVVKSGEKFAYYSYIMEAYLGYIVTAQGYEYKKGSFIQKLILKLLSHRISYPLFRYYADNIILKK